MDISKTSNMIKSFRKCVMSPAQLDSIRMVSGILRFCIEEVDDANITSDGEDEVSCPKYVNETSSLPRFCAAPFITPKADEHSLSSGNAPMELTSTNGSIRQVCEGSPAALPRGSVSANTPVYLEFVGNITCPFKAAAEIVDEPAKVPKTMAGIFGKLKANAEASEENVTEKSIIAVRRGTHENMISHPDLKMLFVKQKENFVKAAETGEKVAHDFIEGYLDKKSSGLLTSWKTTYCRISCNQYLIFKNVQTGLLSGVLDFKKAPVTLSSRPESLTFTYIISFSTCSGIS